MRVESKRGRRCGDGEGREGGREEASGREGREEGGGREGREREDKEASIWRYGQVR